MAKSWIEKRDIDKEFKVKIIPKKFADIPAGTKMFIPTPKIVDKLVKTIPFGSFLYSTQIREKLANNYNAEMTCPVVTGISMRILSEAAFEEFEIHNNIGKITPFWRYGNKSRVSTRFLFFNGIAYGYDCFISNIILQTKSVGKHYCSLNYDYSTGCYTFYC